MLARTYRLEVEGEITDSSWCELENVHMRYAGGNTVIVGLVRDQAELQGVLQRVSSLGLTILSVGMVDD